MPEEPVVVNKCPYCYRPIKTETEEGTWLKDPILTPYGSKYKWADQTTLEEEPYLTKRLYVGIYQIAEEIEALQDYLKDLEEHNLPEGERTEFSPINNTGWFVFKGIHLKEMRESVEKLLEIFEYTKAEYFNYDEEGNHITHPNGDKLDWTDVVENEEDWDKFQIKGIHIEELRHYINMIWIERWNTVPVSTLWSHTGNFMLPGTVSWTPYIHYPGDMGDEVLWGNSLSLSGSCGGTADYSFIGEFINDGSGISTKVHLRNNWSFTTLSSPSGSAVGIGRSSIILPTWYRGFLVNKNTHLTFDASLYYNYSVVGLMDSYSLYFWVGIYNGDWIYYRFQPLNPSTIVGVFPLTQAEFCNFDRNISEDWKTVYGSYLTGLITIHIGAVSGGKRLSWSIPPANPHTCYMSTDLWVDNVKLKSVNTP